MQKAPAAIIYYLIYFRKPLLIWPMIVNEFVAHLQAMIFMANNSVPILMSSA